MNALYSRTGTEIVGVTLGVSTAAILVYDDPEVEECQIKPPISASTRFDRT